MSKSLQVNTDFFENVIAFNALTSSYYASITIDYLLPENFKDTGNKLVISIIRDFYLKRKVLPNVTEIKTYLKTEGDIKLFKDTLARYKQLESSGNQDELIQNTETFFREKSVYNTVKEIINDCANNKEDYGKFLKSFEKACNVNLVNDIGLDFFGNYQRVIKGLGEQTEVIPTGWNFMDSKIGGGLQKNGRALYLFLGPTNVGKSIFLGNIAANLAATGKTTVLISLEMPEMMYAKRISSHLAKIPIGDINSQIPQLESFFKDSHEKHKGKLIIKEFAPKSLTVGGIKSYLESLIKSGIIPEVLVIDYLGLLKASSGDNSYEQGKNIAEELRALTYHFSIPCISAIQTNREGMDVPSLDTVSESLGVAFTADVVQSIYQEEGDMELGIIKTSFIKNRLGPRTGNTAMRIDYSTLSLSEEKDYISLASGNDSDSSASEVDKLTGRLEKLNTPVK